MKIYYTPLSGAYPQDFVDEDQPLERLLDLLKPGDTVYTTITHVFDSGRVRTIKAIVIKKGIPVDISFEIADLLGWKWDADNGGVIVYGSGKNMGLYLICELANNLFPDYPTPASTDKYYIQNGDYALLHKWL